MALKIGADFADSLKSHLAFGTRPDGRTQPWTVKEFAAALGMTQRTISRWLSGTTQPYDLKVVEQVLFGDNLEHDDLRIELRIAYNRELPRREVFSRTMDLSLASRSPRSIKGVPSAFGYFWSEQKTIGIEPSSANTPTFPFSSSEQDYLKRLEVCRTLTAELIEDLEQRSHNIRGEYRLELHKYLARLPSKRDEGNILLADATARTLRDLFAAEAGILPLPFAARLKTILEQHIGLRPFYPEIESFYHDVKSGRLEAPLPLDAINGVITAVQSHTPEIFDPSVSRAFDDTNEGPPVVAHSEASVTTSEPIPPPDPLGELNPGMSHDFLVAGVINKLWQVFMAGEKIHRAGVAWRTTYDSLLPPVSQVLDWLHHFLNK